MAWRRVHEEQLSLCGARARGVKRLGVRPARVRGEQAPRRVERLLEHARLRRGGAVGDGGGPAPLELGEAVECRIEELLG